MYVHMLIQVVHSMEIAGLRYFLRVEWMDWEGAREKLRDEEQSDGTQGWACAVIKRIFSGARDRYVLRAMAETAEKSKSF